MLELAMESEEEFNLKDGRSYIDVLKEMKTFPEILYEIYTDKIGGKLKLKSYLK